MKTINNLKLAHNFYINNKKLSVFLSLFLLTINISNLAWSVDSPAYQVISGLTDPHEARIIIIGNNHGSITDKTLFKNYVTDKNIINQYNNNKKSIVLIEGFERNVENLLTDPRIKKLEYFPHLAELAQDYNIQGWDNHELLSHTTKLVEEINKYVELIREIYVSDPNSDLLSPTTYDYWYSVEKKRQVSLRFRNFFMFQRIKESINSPEYAAGAKIFVTTGARHIFESQLLDDLKSLSVPYSVISKTEYIDAVKKSNESYLAKKVHIENLMAQDPENSLSMQDLRETQTLALLNTIRKEGIFGSEWDSDETQRKLNQPVVFCSSVF